MNRLQTIVLLMLTALVAQAQPRNGYYTASVLDGKSGRDLELALKSIVYTHNTIKYNNLWTAFETTDPGPRDSIPSTYTGGKTDLVYDMYAWMGEYTKFYSDKDHTQTGGFNREHNVPNSWWGGESGNAEAYTDLHHLVPSDGYANNYKGNYALGEYKTGMTLVFPTANKTNTAGYTYARKDNCTHREGVPCLANASHVWKVKDASAYGGSAQLYEPTDEYKGDFARMYLYVVCAYEGELTWQTEYMFTSDANKQTTIKPWAKELLLKWHRQDPVSKKERDRNNAVESVQKNRNPFIDYPELVEYIWGDKSTTPFTLSKAVSAYSDQYGKDDPDTPDTPDTPEEPEVEDTLVYVYGPAAKATYTLQSTSEVAVKDTLPPGSLADYSQTLGGQYAIAGQATKDNTTTLTLKGYHGCIITGITMSMRSNARAGAGMLTVTAGNHTLAALTEATNFNKFYDNTSYGNTYRDVHIAMLDTTYTIGLNEKVTITVTGTTNSVYVERYIIHYKSYDVNGDHIVDEQDVRDLVSMLLGTKEATPAADIDGNGQVDLADVAQLIEYLKAEKNI